MSIHHLQNNPPINSEKIEYCLPTTEIREGSPPTFSRMDEFPDLEPINLVDRETMRLALKLIFTSEDPFIG